MSGKSAAEAGALVEPGGEPERPNAGYKPARGRRSNSRSGVSREQPLMSRMKANYPTVKAGSQEQKENELSPFLSGQVVLS